MNDEMPDSSPRNGAVQVQLDEPVYNSRLTVVVDWLARQNHGSVTSLELAEILWLGMRIPPLTISKISSKPTEVSKSNGQISKLVNLTEDERDSSKLKKLAELPSAKNSEALPTFFPQVPKIGDSSLAREPEALLLPKEVLPDDADLAAALPVRLAQTPPLGDRFSLLQALRPLLGRRRNPLSLQLNEAATVDYYAEARLIVPVMQPCLEPWFDEVILLVDGGVSMQVWHKMAYELRHVLASSQIFAAVRLVFVNGKELGLNGEPVSLQMVPNSCSLLLILSDAAGRHWWDGRMFVALETWGQLRPTMLMQMLPMWHWQRTALAAGDRVSLTNTKAAAANSAYIASRLDWWEEESRLTNGFSLPVITSERGGLGTWSAMVMGNQEYASTGVLLPNQAERQDRLNAFLGDRKLDEQQTLSNDSSAMEQLWQAFRQVASPQAQRLLMVMAAAPVLTLPVMALLKEAKIPESTTPLPIAEILVSSLVLRKPGQEGISDPDQLQFELQPQMAELLVGRLSVGDRLDVLHSVTALVEKRWNRLDTGTSFEAVLCDPSVAPPVGMEGVVQFASVTARLLETLPGEQARRFAERLRRGAGLASPEPWPKQHFTFEDLPYETAKLLPIPPSDLISFSTACYQEMELLPISFETGKLTITSKPEDRTKKKSNQKPVIEIHRSIGSAQAFYEPLQRKNLPPGAIAEAADPLTLTLVEIPQGEFPMGSPPEEPERYDDEGPQHLVKLESFFMAQTPITQAQWREVAGWQPWDGESWGRELKPNPSHFRGGDNQKGGKARLFDGEANTDQRPVEQVNWEDAIEFCNRLSQRTGRHYSLPSEAQWEYACRAGSITPFHFGETLSSELANFDGTEVYAGGLKGDWRRQTTPVGKSLASVTSADAFPANDWGLQDMHGNVWEWCLDQWHPSYEGAPVDGSAWVDADANQANIKKDEESNDRLLRGGSWDFRPGNCRSACRGHPQPGLVNDSVGLRVVCLPQGCSS